MEKVAIVGCGAYMHSDCAGEWRGLKAGIFIFGQNVS